MVVTKATCIPGNLTKAVGTNNADIGAVCTSPNINIWAKYKPVRSSNPGELTEAEKQTANYGMLFDYSRTVKKNNVVVPDGHESGGEYLPLTETIDPQHPDFQWVKYLKPRGVTTYNERFRFFDFVAYGTAGSTKGYDTEALMPLRPYRMSNVFTAVSGTQSQNYMLIFFTDNDPDGNAVVYQAMKASVKVNQHDSTTVNMAEMCVGAVLYNDVEWGQVNQKHCISAYEGRVPHGEITSGIVRLVADTVHLIPGLHTVTEDDVYDYPALFVEEDIGKKCMRIDIEPLDFWSKLEIDSTGTYPVAVKRASVLVRPVLYIGATAWPGTEQGAIRWNQEGTETTDYFVPLRTSLNPMEVFGGDIRIPLSNVFFVYCEVAVRDEGIHDSRHWFSYHLKLRMANCFPTTSGGSTPIPYIKVDRLLVRLYADYYDMSADTDKDDYEQPTFDCNDDLRTITEAEKTQENDWRFDGAPTSRYPNTYFHNDFEYYETDRYIEVSIAQDVEAPYRYFKVKMNLSNDTGALQDFPTYDTTGKYLNDSRIVRQHGVANDNLVQTISSEQV